MRGMFDISVGYEAHRRDEILTLLRDYEASLGISLCFQAFETELADFPGAHAPPSGAIVLARRINHDALCGLVCVRALSGEFAS